jgi:hypothetical protein
MAFADVIFNVSGHVLIFMNILDYKQWGNIILCVPGPTLVRPAAIYPTSYHFRLHRNTLKSARCEATTIFAMKRVLYQL